MSHPLESYAIVGDTETVAVIGRHGSVDWLCLPRFDSGACFAALLGDERHGHWSLKPCGEVTGTRRRYREGTLVLETEMSTAEGAIRLVDSMPPRGTQRGRYPDLVRVVEGVDGRVQVETELVIRFDYGALVPWVTRTERGLNAVAGPDAVTLSAPVDLEGRDRRTVGRFEVAAGERVPFVLTYHPSHEPAPEPVDGLASLRQTEQWWRDWSAAGIHAGVHGPDIVASLRVLKALTYRPTGGIVAAPTTSLPEAIGGARNWDYRYVWVRDATFTLQALLSGGYEQEAKAWRDWLLRAVAGDASQLQIMYGVAGERRLTEQELPWLPGYEGSTPVRIGNGAAEQLQLDVYGEVIDALHQAHRAGLEPEEQAWAMQKVWLDHLEGAWDTPDHGIWEVRSEARHFTHSKLMVWAAFDRAVKAVDGDRLDGPADRWRRLRDDVHNEICERAYDADRNAFTQAYGSTRLDASTLLIPQVGFLPAEDPRFLGTLAAIREHLVIDDLFVRRYQHGETTDGLAGSEGAFLLCSFWLVDALSLAGHVEDAERAFSRLLDCRNDVGLLSEEIDPETGRMLGNFPQAFSHVGLVNSARNLTQSRGPAHDRGSAAGEDG